MSFIKIDMNTDKKTQEISVEIKSECSRDELQVAVGYLMTGLAANTSVELLETMVKEIKDAK